MFKLNKKDFPPRTLKEHNERVKLSSAILTGKEFRRLKRKRK